MAKKVEKTKEQEDGFGTVEEVLSKSEQFLENNQKAIMITVAVIVLAVLGVLGYHKYVKQPRNLRAQNEVFMAQRYFEMDSINLALNGDGNNAGFIEVIDEYGSTTIGNTAKYYAGICYLRMGNYDEALDYLNSFSPKGRVSGAMATGAKGDAYMELGNISKAASYYVEASKTDVNDFITPVFLKKAAFAYELEGKFSDAKKQFEEIQNKYPKSPEARDAEKYIARLDVLIQQ